MNWQGWVFMLLGWSFITILFVYCFYRILTSEGGSPEPPP